MFTGEIHEGWGQMIPLNPRFLESVDSTVRGVSEVGGAVVASTLTTIAVFLPIVFVEGVAGQVFGDMALTVVFSLLASLIVALYFIPMLAPIAE